MITAEERMIFDMLSAKIGHVPKLVINKKQEMELRVSKNFTQYKVKIAIKKNL